MPLMADGRRMPDHFTARGSALKLKTLGDLRMSPQCVRIALINNMPDAALEDTESQFFDLLAAAAAEMAVHVGLYSLPEVPRGERAKRHVANYYRAIEELWGSRVDGIIITGTEPRQRDLRQEPYWGSLSTLFEWAESNTKSTVLSCLAAHAGVLHSDGIERHPLQQKKFGVFDQIVARPHALTEHIAAPLSFPHSRWNGVRQEDLSAAGYTILTTSAETGPDLFVKKKRQSLFVHFQGHPEYGARTLLKEYRRDIGRFLKKERDDYPAMPHSYFDSESATMLANFRANAESNRTPELLPTFPEEELGRRLQHRWRAAATGIYGNWLRYVAARKIDAPRLATAASASCRARPY